MVYILAVLLSMSYPTANHATHPTSVSTLVASEFVSLEACTAGKDIFLTNAKSVMGNGTDFKQEMIADCVVKK